MDRTLIIASNSDAFGLNLKYELALSGAPTSLLDFKTLMLVDENENSYDYYFKKYENYIRIPKLGLIFRIFAIRRILREMKYTTVNIHIPRVWYILIVNTLKKKRIIVTFYGSDFYRINSLSKSLMKYLYTISEALTFTNPVLRDSFCHEYPNLAPKAHICRFGLRTLDFIDSNRHLTKLKIKEIIGLNTTKKTITCGSNSTPEQQILKIIDELKKIPIQILNKAQFVFPLGYGSSKYAAKVKRALLKSNLDYRLIEDYLIGDDNAHLRLASDVMINVLVTDSFSGSMQEHLYADNIIICGSWLPYKILDDAGINYLKVNSVSDLPRLLMPIIDNTDFHFSTENNRDIIGRLSLWRNAISSWLNILKMEKDNES